MKINRFLLIKYCIFFIFIIIWFFMIYFDFLKIAAFLSVFTPFIIIECLYDYITDNI